MISQIGQLDNSNQPQIDAKFAEVVPIFHKIIKDDVVHISIIIYIVLHMTRDNIKHVFSLFIRSLKAYPFKYRSISIYQQVHFPVVSIIDLKDLVYHIHTVKTDWQYLDKLKAN